MIGIYKITNPNNAIYIGQSIDLNRRIRNYKKVSKDQTYLFNSINKYGYENHKFEIIHELPEDVSQEILTNYEVLYWELYKDCGFEMINLVKPSSNYVYNKDALKRKSESLKKNWENRKRKVYQYSKTGEFIKEWNSILECSRILKINRANIYVNLIGESKSITNFIFKFVN